MERIEMNANTIEAMGDLARDYACFFTREQEYCLYLMASPYAYQKETDEMVFEEDRATDKLYKGSCLDSIVEEMILDLYKLMSDGFMESFGEDWVSSIVASFGGDTFYYIEGGEVFIGNDCGECGNVA